MPQRPSFEALFRVSPNAYLLLDPELVILDANAAYLKLTSRTLEDLLGRRVQDAFAADPRCPQSTCIDELLESFTRVLRTKAMDVVPQIRYSIAVNCGSSVAYEDRYWSATHTPLLGEQGDVLAILQHAGDITEQDRSGQERRREHLEELVRERTRELLDSEAERRVAQAALMQAQKLEAVGKLTGGIAHDFNNMLQIIGGNLQLLRRNISGDETAQRRLDSAVGGVEKGARLASQLLAFASRQSLLPQTVDIGDLLGQMSELLSGALGSAVQVEVEGASGLWPVFADVGNLQAAILNLAVNARDAMRGGGTLRLRLRNRSLDAAQLAEQPGAEAGPYVELVVMDEGEGMQPEVLERAFEPFFTTRTESNASGLGLSMVYGFVKQSGGFVVLESEPGKGTWVRVYLPSHRALGEEEVRADAAPGQQGSVAAPAEQADVQSASGLKILFVEDDPTLRMLTGEVLDELGHQVRLCESAEDALEQLDHHPFDVLLTDVGLGGMSGIELVRQAKARDASLSVVIASGYAVDAREVGLDDLRTMIKPYDIHQVRSLLENIQSERTGAGRG
jgi:signal transduction histidine kinase/ActR/RegA family two-component response regulator